MSFVYLVSTFKLWWMTQDGTWWGCAIWGPEGEAKERNEVGKGREKGGMTFSACGACGRGEIGWGGDRVELLGRERFVYFVYLCVLLVYFWLR